ncbi:phytase [Catenovulum adriaticum]|uniref:Phytase n=1 Tax=Catenovulum adriaticum TaxID=2984846 RepID=A0ABY7ARG0_9ALTE|nr:phytase [Catenovulum sp. TS8]WAJ71852.1 phytase [Catenovulum sp. TS8]
MKNCIYLICLVSLLLGCQSAKTTDVETQQANTLVTQPLFDHAQLNGQKVIQLTPTHWLANSENLGIFVFDNKQIIVSQYQGNYESLDIRKISDNQWFVTSIEKEQGQLESFLLSSNQGQYELARVAKIRSENAAMESQCLYYDRANGFIYNFSLTAQHQVEQKLIYQVSSQQAKNISIRRFSSPPASSACAVNDVTQDLFIVEETIGVWQYPVDPEKDLLRQPVAMVDPFGKIAGEIKDITLLSDGSVLVALPEAQQIHHYTMPFSSGKVMQYSLPEIAVEGVSAYLTNNGWQVSLYDDESGNYLSAPLDLKLNTHVSAPAKIKHIQPSMETEPVARFGDAADDPEIWLNAQNAENSKILTTDKTYGLNVYNLKGNLTQTIASGRINNIDISYGAHWKNEKFDLAAASNRTHNSISLYKINAEGEVVELADIPTNLSDVYGLCSYKSPASGDFYVFINDENGHFQQYQIHFEAQISGELVREFSVDTQPEGCAVDLSTQTLYLGEEDKGIWQISAEPIQSQLKLFYAIDNQVLFDDVEGLSVYHSETKNEANYLIASSQGNDSYLVFDLNTNKVVTNFKIGAAPLIGIDGASETDGLAVISAPLGEQYPAGALIVQDGRNVMPAQPQNFKLVDWRNVRKQW